MRKILDAYSYKTLAFNNCLKGRHCSFYFSLVFLNHMVIAVNGIENSFEFNIIFAVFGLLKILPLFQEIVNVSTYFREELRID